MKPYYHRLVFEKKYIISILLLTLITVCSACRGFYLTHVEPMEIMGFEEIIYDDTTWEKDESPIRVTKNTFIIPEATLTIEPGVEVLLGPGVVIKNFGRIVAEGTSEFPIVFSRLSDQYWGHFDCFGGRVEEDGKLPVNVFEHCIIEGGRGMTIRAGAVRMESCILRNNVSSPIRLEYTSGVIHNNKIYANTTIQDTASGNGAGIMVYTDKMVTISENEVFDNASSGGRDGGGGIYAYAYDTGNVSILKNRIYSNKSDRHGGGLVAYSCYVEGNSIYENRAEGSGGGIHAIRSLIKNNAITNNFSKRGGGIYAEDSEVNFNAVIHNRAPSSKGGGMYYYGEGSIQNNSFEGNGTGDTIVVSGNPEIRKNNIITENGFALRVGTHSLASDLDARENYWGTNKEEMIHFLVYDWLDDSDIGLVDWKEFSHKPIPDAPRLVSEGMNIRTKEDPTKDTNVLKGVLSSSSTIGLPGGVTYSVTENVLIPKGVEIIILPGTVFDVLPEVTFRIRGSLYAEGNEKEPIRFTGKRENPWGMLFYDKRGAVDDEAQTKESSGKLTHCIVENGKGILMEGTGPGIDRSVIRNNSGSGISIRNATVEVTNCLITQNSSSTNGGGIYTYGSKLVFLSNNRIIDNLAEEDGGGIFAYGYRSDTAANLIGNRIEGNSCKGDGGGVWASRSSLSGNQIIGNKAEGNGGGVYVTFALVKENSIKNNTAFQGGGVYAETNSTLENNKIQTNRATENLGGGVYLNFWGMSIKNEVFEGNLVKDNSAGLPGSNGGIYLNGAMRFEKNNIYGNTGYQLYNGNCSNHKQFQAYGCYWGTGKKDKISKMIFDGYDDQRLSKVEFYPFSPVEIKK